MGKVPGQYRNLDIDPISGRDLLQRFPNARTLPDQRLCHRHVGTIELAPLQKIQHFHHRSQHLIHGADILEDNHPYHRGSFHLVVDRVLCQVFQVFA